MSHFYSFLIVVFFFLPSSVLAQNQKLEKKLRVSLLDKEAVENGNMPNLFVFYQKGDAEGYFSERMNAPYLSTELPIMVGDLSQLWASLAIQQLVEAHQFSYSADLNQFLPRGYQNTMPRCFNRRAL